MLRIKFAGKKWLFTGDTLAQGGAITTPEAFTQGTVSHAHLFKNGMVMRFKKQIGTVADIEVLGESDVPIPDDAESLARLLTDDSWDHQPKED